MKKIFLGVKIKYLKMFDRFLVKSNPFKDGHIQLS